VLVEACLDSGIVARRGPVCASDRHSAARWLLEASDGTEALPFETECLLADLDPVRVRAIVRLRLP